MFLTVVQVFLALLLVVLVLLQSPESDGLGSFGSAQSGFGSMFPKSSPSSFISRLTAVVATAFIINTLLLVGTSARHMRGTMASSIISGTEQGSSGSEVPSG